jgi:hypothetical protein
MTGSKSENTFFAGGGLGLGLGGGPDRKGLGEVKEMLSPDEAQAFSPLLLKFLDAERKGFFSWSCGGFNKPSDAVGLNDCLASES